MGEACDRVGSAMKSARRAALCAALFTTVFALAPSPGRAVEASVESLGYRVDVAGIRVGTFELEVERREDAYEARLDGRYRVLFWSGAFSAETKGVFAENAPAPTLFRAESQSDRPSTSEIAFAPGEGPTRWGRTPPAPAKWTKGRLPLKEEHLAGSLDPLSAIAGSLLKPDPAEASALCQEPLRIFTGFTVFQLDFTKAEPRGRSRLRCSARYTALSGHRADSRSVKRLSGPEAIRISYRQNDAGLWSVASVSMPTTVGTLTVKRR
ncbi:MAG: DUF3108 domain-containing protein [Pseudomonadota bacterium]